MTSDLHEGHYHKLASVFLLTKFGDHSPQLTTFDHWWPLTSMKGIIIIHLDQGFFWPSLGVIHVEHCLTFLTPGVPRDPAPTIHVRLLQLHVSPYTCYWPSLVLVKSDHACGRSSKLLERKKKGRNRKKVISSATPPNLSTWSLDLRLNTRQIIDRRVQCKYMVIMHNCKLPNYIYDALNKKENLYRRHVDKICINDKWLQMLINPLNCMQLIRQICTNC